MKTKIFIGCDHGGLLLKKEIIHFLSEANYIYEDMGTDSEEPVDYPDFAAKVSQKVVQESNSLGILICGTGIGMSIAANKIKGIRCAIPSQEFSARMSREHNDCNILALGQRVLGSALALSIVKTWLHAEFQGARHQQRVDKIMRLQK